MTIWEYLESLEKKKKPAEPRVRLGAPPVRPEPPFDPFNPDGVNTAPYFQTFPEQSDETRQEIFPRPDRPDVNVGAFDPFRPEEEQRPVLTQPPRPVDDLTEAENRVKLLYNTPVQNNDKGVMGRVGDVLRQAVISAGQAYDKNLAAGMKPGDALMSSAGGAVAGGLYGGFHPEVDEERQRLFDVQQAEGQVDRIRLKNAWEMNEAAKKAQIENIYEDNRRSEEQRQDRLRIADEKAQETGLQNWFKQHPFFDPDRATQSEIAQLAKLGRTPKDMGKYDTTKPDFKQIGGNTFRWDKSEQAFVDTNLPKDKSKAFVEITAKDPVDGKTYTYVTSNDKAAGYLNAKIIGNMQIVAARDRQVSQQQFSAQQLERRAALAKQLEEYKNIQKEIQSEKNFERKKELQQRSIEARKKLEELRLGIEDDDAVDASGSFEPKQ